MMKGQSENIDMLLISTSPGVNKDFAESEHEWTGILHQVKKILKSNDQ
jgi:hypothetical protein